VHSTCARRFADLRERDPAPDDTIERQVRPALEGALPADPAFPARP